MDDKKLDALIQQASRTKDIKLDYVTQLPSNWNAIPPSLTRLSLCDNALRELPEALTNLIHLTSLRLSRNELTAVPDFVTRLPLKDLWLDNNKITALPPSFPTLTTLTDLRLTGNALDFPPEVFARGIGSLFTYIEFTDRGVQKKLIADLQSRESANSSATEAMKEEMRQAFSVQREEAEARMKEERVVDETFQQICKKAITEAKEICLREVENYKLEHNVRLELERQESNAREQILWSEGFNPRLYASMVSDKEQLAQRSRDVLISEVAERLTFQQTEADGRYSIERQRAEESVYLTQDMLAEMKEAGLLRNTALKKAQVELAETEEKVSAAQRELSTLQDTIASEKNKLAAEREEFEREKQAWEAEKAAAQQELTVTLQEEREKVQKEKAATQQEVQTSRQKMAAQLKELAALKAEVDKEVAQHRTEMETGRGFSQQKFNEELEIRVKEQVAIEQRNLRDQMELEKQAKDNELAKMEEKLQRETADVERQRRELIREKQVAEQELQRERIQMEQERSEAKQQMAMSKRGTAPGGLTADALAQIDREQQQQQQQAANTGVTGGRGEVTSVGINVGGQLFVSSKQTLCAVHDNFFNKLLSGRMTVPYDTFGNLFVDRNSANFTIILERLRYGMVDLTSFRGSFAQLEDDAIFFGLPDLHQEIQAEKARRKSQGNFHADAATGCEKIERKFLDEYRVIDTKISRAVAEIEQVRRDVERHKNGAIITALGTLSKYEEKLHSLTLSVGDINKQLTQVDRESSAGIAGIYRQVLVERDNDGTEATDAVERLALADQRTVTNLESRITALERDLRSGAGTEITASEFAWSESPSAYMN
eukprot:TRINITY_DN65762_c4_g1_i1.p1 TRINITY_DN65762_c4_g1~~TRINITY_DN65762_c4_g1_i1.p1  ORF type:complete len:918 (+),score=128.29 TRINITY_DN65762_c4_g1_i1:256-2754(+)